MVAHPSTTDSSVSFILCSLKSKPSDVRIVQSARCCVRVSRPRLSPLMPAMQSPSCKPQGSGGVMLHTALYPGTINR